MADALFNGKRFGTVMWGYERDEVDDFVSEYEKWGEALTTELETAQAQLGESTRHVRSLQATVAKLEERAGEVPPDSVRSFAGRLEEIVGDAWTAGQTLRDRVASEAASDHEKAKASASELIETAEARACQISADAARDREEAARELRAARDRAERILAETEAAANERSQQAWAKTEARIREAEADLGRLEERRRMTLDELTRLRGSLEGMVSAA